MFRVLRTFRPLAVALALSGFMAAPVLAGADFVVTRTSGVAPLLVQFDATSTTAPSAGDPFHEVYFHWTFDDAGAGTWTHSGSPKDEAHGPLAAHVYESPGTYIARLETLDPDGATSAKTVTITVQDPDSVFSGSNTTCVSASGDFAGCPTGANHVTSNSFGTAVSNAAPGRRVLLRRGDVFVGGATLNGNGPGILGAYGTGSLPRVDYGGGVTALEISNNGVNLRDWRIMDIAFQGTQGLWTSGIMADAYLEQVLILRVDIRNFWAGIMMEWGRINKHGEPHLYDQVGVVDSLMLDQTRPGMFAALKRAAILGNTVRNTVDSHLMRFEHLSESVLSHNLLAGGAKGRHHLKLHAMDTSLNTSFAERDSVEVVIAENVVVGGDNGWNFTLGPQNNITDERIRQMIVERNRFESSPATNVHLHVWGRDVTVRNNLYDPSDTFVVVGQRGIEPPPDNVQVYDNCALPGSCTSFAGGGSAPSPSPSPAPAPTPQPPAAPVLLP